MHFDTLIIGIKLLILNYFSSLGTDYKVRSTIFKRQDEKRNISGGIPFTQIIDCDVGWQLVNNTGEMK